MIDNKQFFDGWRKNMKQYKLSKKRVEALDQLIGFMNNDEHLTDIRHQAYVLATCAHETGFTFRPIKEKRQVSTNTPRRRKIRKLQDRYWSTGFYGRGYVQITWEDNYRKLGLALSKEDGFSDYGQGWLCADPDKALIPEHAYEIISIGMRKGLFTGKKLSDYITDNVFNYRDARRIVNGTDKAAQIAGYAKKFETMLRESSTVEIEKSELDKFNDERFNGVSDNEREEYLKKEDEVLMTYSDNVSSSTLDVHMKVYEKLNEKLDTHTELWQTLHKTLRAELKDYKAERDTIIMRLFRRVKALEYKNKNWFKRFTEWVREEK